MKGEFRGTTTRFFGLALIALGIIGYIATDAVSVTALIPAFFGIVLMILGWVARNERYRKHAMHVAAVVGVVGFVGAAPGLVGLLTLLSGGGSSTPGCRSVAIHHGDSDGNLCRPLCALVRRCASRAACVEVEKNLIIRSARIVWIESDSTACSRLPDHYRWRV